MTSAPDKNDSLTPSQRRAVAARGNVLVMAGAGTGKTKTLIARCLDCLERERAALDELLIVTFTEAAAAEMRVRLRKSLEEKTAASPEEIFWQEQIARFDLAHIGTLHGFCLKLVREHFYELGLDPRLAILDEGEARQLASETLNDQFTAHYEGKESFSPAVQELIQIHGGGRDEKIRQLILRLHHYSQTRPNAADWLRQHRERFSAAEPADWQNWLAAAIADWRDEWLPLLENLKLENEKTAELAGLLSRLKKQFTRELAAELLEQIISADGKENFPKGQFTKLRKPLEKLFDEAAFLVSIAAVKNDTDPLAEDWSWVRGQMETLLRLAEEFADKFSERKRADGVLDFHDLEQFALKLLWNFSENQPTDIAKNWRAKLKFVFVDEYQDINAAQDKIIAALSRDGADANRFLVGDVKQSIYRFRLADPQIFRDYAHNWRGDAGQTIPLATNFRSREGLLNFVNSVFRQIMRPGIGGVNYGEDAELKFGLSEKFSVSADRSPRAELLVRFKNGRNESREDEGGDLADLNDAQREARLVAWRLKQIVAARHEIFDDEKKVFRPVEWRDMAILLRSPRGKSEIFAKEFERAGIPLAVARGGFYESAEILDLLSLLRLLDNPLQDVPCIAVLRSPLVGLSLDELAEIRLAAKAKHFWTALVRSQKSEVRSQNLAAKVLKFLEQFSHWRRLAKQVSLSQCLEEILAETLYADWLRAQPRGAQRAANIASFLHLAQAFDQFQRQGLFRFLKFIEAEQAAEAEPEVPAAATENAVRLMSIHQSKGLEFPVVALADLAKNFNEQDLHAEIIFDEQFGLCPKIKPPGAGGRYPSLPHWLAQRRQQRELRGEELRLLYVAMTRARDNLILTAGVTEKNWDERWMQTQPMTPQKIAAAKSFADWLALWFSNQSPKSKAQNGAVGELENLRWQMVDDATIAEKSEIRNPKSEIVSPTLDAASLEKLSDRLEQDYPFTAATKRKAKSSVTALRRAAEESDDEAEGIFRPRPAFPKNSKSKIRNQKLDAAEAGTAHHKFLQHFRLEQTGDLTAEAARLVRENYLSAAEGAALELAALADFWSSEFGRRIVAHSTEVRRELPFTARFSPAEIAAITGAKPEAGLEKEFVVVQGVADLAVILPGEIWLLDFKTDAVDEGDLPEKIKSYRPQLQLYAAALEKVFARKVTRRALHFLSARKTVET
jgi:ATP-dependent helicase/nuclease subunit A